MALFCVMGVAVCASASAQSLVLSYKLAPASGPADAHVATAVDRCAGLTWVGSLTTAGCISDLVARAAVRLHQSGVTVLPAGQSVSEAAVQTRGGEAPDLAAADSSAYSGAPLPVAATDTTDTRVLRASPRNTLEPGKGLDVLLRFASKYRLRNGEEGWEVFKFKDVTSENRTQQGLKGVAVELFVPFQ